MSSNENDGLVPGNAVVDVDMVVRLDVFCDRNNVEVNNNMPISRVVFWCFLAPLTVTISLSSVYHLEGEAEDEKGVNSSWMVIVLVLILSGVWAGCWNNLFVGFFNCSSSSSSTSSAVLGIIRYSSWCTGDLILL